MNIQPLHPGMEAELTDFLNSLATTSHAPSVLGYHYPAYLQMLQQVLGSGTSNCSFIARCPRNAAIRGFLPGLIHQSSGGCCYNSLPFFGPNAGVLSDAEDPDEERAVSVPLIEAAISAARNRNALTAVFYTRFDPFPNPVAASPGLWLTERHPDVIQVSKTTHFLPLNAAISASFPSTIRYDLRKAVQAGVVISSGCPAEQLEELYDIYVQNCLDHGIPLKPFDCVQRLHQASLTDRTIQFYTAKVGSDLAGGLITLWGPVTVSYYLPCSRREYRTLQPGTLAIAHAMQHAADHGRRIWNWESTSEHSNGVAHFKSKWGSSKAQYQVLVVPLQGPAAFQGISPEQLAREFPFYFVYPYSLLQGTAS